MLAPEAFQILIHGIYYTDLVLLELLSPVTLVILHQNRAFRQGSNEDNTKSA